eukprot:TRINITY_DN5190_c0_g1_i1.p1 TRINITY_DN5190_c0_g1~~TRINITY_DN5190_c0_g1_i1.p1  ORF type:complete len:472 (-),score=88.70 TRINITY_DN5190_c0_g1_i1:43-1458(-)
MELLLPSPFEEGEGADDVLVTDSAVIGVVRNDQRLLVDAVLATTHGHTVRTWWSCDTPTSADSESSGGKCASSVPTGVQRHVVLQNTPLPVTAVDAHPVDGTDVAVVVTCGLSPTLEVMVVGRKSNPSSGVLSKVVIACNTPQNCVSVCAAPRPSSSTLSSASTSRDNWLYLYSGGHSGVVWRYSIFVKTSSSGGVDDLQVTSSVKFEGHTDHVRSISVFPRNEQPECNNSDDADSEVVGKTKKRKRRKKKTISLITPALATSSDDGSVRLWSSAQKCIAHIEAKKKHDHDMLAVCGVVDAGGKTGTVAFGGKGWSLLVHECDFQTSVSASAVGGGVGVQDRLIHTRESAALALTSVIRHVHTNAQGQLCVARADGALACFHRNPDVKDVQHRWIESSSVRYLREPITSLHHFECDRGMSDDRAGDADDNGGDVVMSDAGVDADGDGNDSEEWMFMTGERRCLLIRTPESS